MVAVVLATALITCVTHFAASGAAMIRESVGGGLTMYSTMYVRVLVVPAVFLSVLIMLMAVVVISNVFRVSASARTAEFGTLKCVGATPAQIRKTMLWEAALLALIGIPLGLLLGLGLTAGGIAIANHFFDELNSPLDVDHPVPLQKEQVITIPVPPHVRHFLRSATLGP